MGRKLTKPESKNNWRGRRMKEDSFPAAPLKWAFTISGVPYWGPYSKGILVFGVYMRGPLLS